MLNQKGWPSTPADQFPYFLFSGSAHVVHPGYDLNHTLEVQDGFIHGFDLVLVRNSNLQVFPEVKGQMAGGI